MTKQQIEKYLEKYEMVFTMLGQRAAGIHENVNQTYGEKFPYSYHLKSVCDIAIEYLHLVLGREEDFLPVLFGAYFHDSIEDARLSYNDVKKIAAEFMSEDQSLLAAEIVYALTNDKGRTRQERAGENYYKGIRSTPYAPYVKMCDRLANTAFSFGSDSDRNNKMKDVYRKEYPHFLQSITVENNDDIRFSIPKMMLAKMDMILADGIKNK